LSIKCFEFFVDIKLSLISGLAVWKTANR